MINNENDITEYKSRNKIYIPEEVNQNNWQYKMNGDYITIISNQNCQTNYNTTYCNCYYYNWKENVLSEVYTCNTNNSNPTINRNNITSDINYSSHIRNEFIQDKGIYISMIIVGILFAIFLTKERKSY